MLIKRTQALDYTPEQCKANPVLWSNFGNGQPTFEPSGHEKYNIISINLFACLSTTNKVPGLTHERHTQIGSVYYSDKVGMAQASGMFAALDGVAFTDKYSLAKEVADIAEASGFIVLCNRNNGYTYRIR